MKYYTTPEARYSTALRRYMGARKAIRGQHVERLQHAAAELERCRRETIREQVHAASAVRHEFGDAATPGQIARAREAARRRVREKYYREVG